MPGAQYFIYRHVKIARHFFNLFYRGFLQAFLSPWLPFDMMAWAYIVPAVWIEVGVYSGFVVWKAKAENMSKHGRPQSITNLPDTPYELADLAQNIPDMGNPTSETIDMEGEGQ